MLMNNLDPEVPHEVVVYGGTGRAARDWESFDRIVVTLIALEGGRDAVRGIRKTGWRFFILMVEPAEDRTSHDLGNVSREVSTVRLRRQEHLHGFRNFRPQTCMRPALL